MSMDMGWSRRIKEAIENGRFALACQPIVDTRTREIESYEVLIRMLDDNNEILLPGGFMPRRSVLVWRWKSIWVIFNGKKTVAEFVENEECFQLLKQNGVDYAQGYHPGRPDIVMPCKAISDHVGSTVVCQLPSVRTKQA